MVNIHRELTHTEQAAPCIEELGGKLGGLRFLQDTQAQLRPLLFPTNVVRPDETWDGELPSGAKEVIVRGSHPNDVNGLVDVLRTRVVPANKRAVGETIEEIREAARRASVIKYAKEENPSYDGRVIVGIQPYGGSERGSIVEHPNRPGEYVISHVMNDSSMPSGMRVSSSGVYDPRTGAFTRAGDRVGVLSGADSVVKVYESIKKAGLIRDDYSFQVEFLHADGKITAINQVRAFRPFELVTPFEVPHGKNRLVFGVTGPDGVVLPAHHAPLGYLEDENGNPKAMEGPWALLGTYHNGNPGLSYTPQLGAYLVSQSFETGLTDSLEHHHFRLAQRAALTVFEDIFQRGDFTSLFPPMDREYLAANARIAECVSSSFRNSMPYCLISTEGYMGKVRIISNGRQASVLRVEE